LQHYTSAVCDAFAYHGFFGKEAETISAIKGWMVGSSYPTDFPAPLNKGSYALPSTAVSFGDQSVGGLAAGKSLVLTNTGDSALAIASIVATNDFSASDDCGYSLAAGANCNIKLAVVPSTLGTRTGSLTINANTPSNPQSVGLTATGVTGTAPQMPIVKGWNLVGNAILASVDIASAYGDANRVASVWKWLSAKSRWAFYEPSSKDNGALFAASSGFDPLVSVNAGEGFWVYAKSSFNAQGPSGTGLPASAFQSSGSNALAAGWNLISTADTVLPAQFAANVDSSIESVWAWDSAVSKWYFFAPTLAAQGGTVLSDYVNSRGYLDFSKASKPLGAGVGFWVRKR
jgi:hypothetical protein